MKIQIGIDPETCVPGEIFITASEGLQFVTTYCDELGGSEMTSFDQHNDEGLQGKLREATRVFRVRFFTAKGILLDYTPEVLKSS